MPVLFVFFKCLTDFHFTAGQACCTLSFIFNNEHSVYNCLFLIFLLYATVCLQSDQNLSKLRCLRKLK